MRAFLDAEPSGACSESDMLLKIRSSHDANRNCKCDCVNYTLPPILDWVGTGVTMCCMAFFFTGVTFNGYFPGKINS